MCAQRLGCGFDHRRRERALRPHAHAGEPHERGGHLAFSYDPGTPVETKSIWCPDAPGGTDQRTHWRDYYTQMHANERHGSGFRAQATIVGAGTFTGWVYNHTGVGSEGPLQEETSIEIEHTPQP